MHATRPAEHRSGKIIAILVLLFPTLFGVLGLMIDGSRLMVNSSVLQHAADAAAVAAAAEIAQGNDESQAALRALESVQILQGLSTATVDVQQPPAEGLYTGQAGYVSVRVTQAVPSLFMRVLNGVEDQSVSAFAVAGQEASTAGAAIVILDPDPPGIDLPVIAGLALPSTPALHLGGLEVLGLGAVEVDGAVLVNNEWGGVDEHGDPAGEGGFLRSAVTAMPLLSLTKLKARDLRVVGGVDQVQNYGPLVNGEDSPLHAGALPVPDPLADLPAPTVSVDPTNVKATLRGGVTVISLPLLAPPVVLQPGVYEYIQIVTGRVTFQPGVYIIRGKHPLTNIPLQMIGGQVTADGVMFYITDSASYSANSGSPDSGDGETQPAATNLGTVLPSAVINAGLLGSRYSPLNSPGSPFHGVLIYQRRADRRIIVISRDTLLAGNEFGGTIYAKWGHLVLAGSGTFDTRFVVGSMRFVNVIHASIEPTQLLTPATDVFLVE